MKHLLLAATVAATALAGALEFRIEGEHFPNKNGWVAGTNNGAVGKSVLFSKGFKKDDPASCVATGRTVVAPAVND
ncbi:MAG: hypothetical protein MJ016_05280, partial [Victivallaceae bacterium]|nr:hypothetical protein [Victivallaceae bacterium]